MNHKSSISIYASHDASICINPAPNIYRIFEFERLLQERYCKINEMIEFEESCIKIREIIKKEYNIDSFSKCYFGQFLDGKKEEQKQMFKKVFNIDQLEEVGHHYSHAACALYQSNFEECLILSYDGGGIDDDGVSSFNIFHGNKTTKEIKRLQKINLDLGAPYTVIARVIKEIHKNGSGLSWPGKKMGLVGYGKIIENLVQPMEHFYKTCFWNGTFDQLAVVGQSIGVNLSSVNCIEGQTAYDIAATSQHVFEKITLETIIPYIDKYKLPVCIVGGCALNVLFNQTLKDKISYPIFIPPNPNDCGIALGQILLKEPPDQIVDITYNGFGILDIDELDNYINQYNATKVTPIEIATLLSKGNIIGILRGNSECGPRALGNRSIICDPSFPNMKDVLNEKVKQREWFRPFAPIVKLEEVSKYFYFTGESKYMTYAPKIKPEWKNILPSIVHFDDTARIQTITQSENKFIYDILDELEKIKNFSVILNTSFNIKGKPILTTIKDAINILENTSIDFVIIENYLFKKIK